MQTVVGVGHPLARKLYSVATFANMQRAASFRKNLIGPAPKQADAEKKLKGQTSSDYPFVRVTDLSKTAGDNVSVDLFNIIVGKPVMGDKKLAGTMSDLTSSSMDIHINQSRKGVDPGGRMTQQRTLHNLRTIGTANLSGWMNRYEDQLCQVHVAGARGYQPGSDWVVPLAADPDFADITVNPVLAPTANRRLFAGAGNNSVADLATTDFLDLQEIDRLRAVIDDQVFPPQPIRLEGDPYGDEQDMYCMFVTSRQWHFIQTNSDAGNWRSFLAEAHKRSVGFKHPLFMGTTGVWNGIVIKKTRRAIRFAAADLVQEVDGAGVEQAVAAAVATDRAFLLGAQALGIVYGRHQKSDYYFNWHEEETDHGNTVEFSVASMSGKAKLRFTDVDGVVTDHGVYTIDSYAPAP